jgi:uncharacterized membrane protein YqjE
MPGDNNHLPGLATLIGRVAGTGARLLRNRTELLALEYQEEKARRMELIVLAISVVLLAFLALGLLTGIVIFLFPEERRLYVAGAFTLLYLAGAGWAATSLKSLLNKAPFAASLEQVAKDQQWAESFK